MDDTELAEPTKVNGWAGAVTMPGTMGCCRECRWSALLMCLCGAFREGRKTVAEGAAIVQHDFSGNFLSSAVFWMEHALVIADCLETDHLEPPCLCHYIFPLWFSALM